MRRSIAGNKGEKDGKDYKKLPGARGPQVESTFHTILFYFLLSLLSSEALFILFPLLRDPVKKK